METGILRFQPQNTWLYTLHPVIKGGGVFAGMVAFSFHGHGLPWTLAGLFLLASASRLGKAPFHEAVFALGKIKILLTLVFFMQLFNGGWESFPMALDSIFRLCGIFLLSGIFMSMTSQAELLYFWEWCFIPFSFFGFPSREWALVMVIAIRFMPVILEEIDRVKMAQIARGADLDRSKGGFLKRTRSLMSLLVPTLVMAIQKANNLAVAMEARGYRLDKPRSRYRQFPFRMSDMLAATLVVLFLIVCFIPRTWLPI